MEIDDGSAPGQASTEGLPSIRGYDEAVAAASHGDLEARLAGEANGSGHVGGAAAAGDDRRANRNGLLSHIREFRVGSRLSHHRVSDRAYPAPERYSGDLPPVSRTLSDNVQLALRHCGPASGD